jgi:hypothetical protein
MTISQSIGTEALNSTERLMLTEFVYVWPDGREEVRYRRQSDTHECAGMREQVDGLRVLHGDKSPYFYREVPGWEELTNEPPDEMQPNSITAPTP